MSDTFKAALDAALQFHGSAQAGVDPEEIIGTAKRFYRELAVAAPSGVGAYDESWYDQVHQWLRVLSSDQLGCVKDAVNRIAAERNPPAAPLLPQPPGPYMPVPPVHSEAWALLDKLDGPQPYPGTAAPIGPLVTRDELERELAKLDCDPRRAGDVEKAAETLPAEHKRWVGPSEELVEILGVTDDESIRDAARRVTRERTDFQVRAERAEATIRNATFAFPDSERARPAEGPALVAGDTIRVRPLGADVWVSTTVTAEVTYSPTEGFVTFVPTGAFSEATKDQISTESADALLKLLAPAKLHGTVTQQVKELVGTVESLRGQLQARDVGIREQDKQLREVLDAWGESDDWDNPHNEESSLDAARRVMRELEASEKHVQHLAWQLAEEQASGLVRKYGPGIEPPMTVSVLKLVVPPAEHDALGGCLLRLGEGWIRVQRKPEQMPTGDGTEWSAAFPRTGIVARELTGPEMARWEEAGR